MKALEPKSTRAPDYEARVTFDKPEASMTGIDIASMRITLVPTEAVWRAWVVPLPDLQPHEAACIGSWLIDGPGPHAFWRCWRLILIHLRPVPGLPPAHLAFPEATHELLSEAIDPSMAPNPDRYREICGLLPADFAVQFAASSDATATRAIDLAIRNGIMRGRLHPDSDYREAWRATLNATAACIDSGKHPTS